MSGAEVTHHPDGSWIRDVVRFKCDRWEFRFRQRTDVAHGKIEPLKGTFCKTTTVEVEGVHPDHRENALATLDAICWLLSFASQSRVLCYGHYFPVGRTTGEIKTVDGVANYFRPPFDLHDTDALKGFVEQSYPAYCKLRRKRKLPAIFDYLVWAERPSRLKSDSHSY
jgi:hypothetical protein